MVRPSVRTALSFRPTDATNPFRKGRAGCPQTAVTSALDPRKEAPHFHRFVLFASFVVKKVWFTTKGAKSTKDWAEDFGADHLK